MQSVRILEMPDCRMVSSGVGMFGDENFNLFMEWHEKQPRGLFPRDFLFWDGSNPEKQGFNWLYMYEDGMEVPEGLSVVDFKGGLYALTTDIDQQTDMEAMYAQLNEFLAANGLKRDLSRPDLGNVITPPKVKEILGYEQMEYYTPVSER